MPYVDDGHIFQQKPNDWNFACIRGVVESIASVSDFGVNFSSLQNSNACNCYRFKRVWRRGGPGKEARRGNGGRGSLNPIL